MTTTLHPPGDEVEPDHELDAPGLVLDDGDEPLPPDDPTVVGAHRFRARRVAVREAARRRRRRLLAAAAAVVLLAGGGYASLRSPLLDVDNLDVVGALHLDPADVLRAAGLRQGMQMVDVDPAAARRGLGRLGWVESVRVIRRWPATVEVRLTERRGVAVVDGEGARFVVAADGTVTGPAGSLDAGLPVVALDPTVAPREGGRLPDRVAAGVVFVASVPETVRAKVKTSTVAADGAAQLTLAKGAVVRLGTAEDAAQKFVALESILGGAVVLDGMERIDVSVPSAPTVLRRR